MCELVVSGQNLCQIFEKLLKKNCDFFQIFMYVLLCQNVSIFPLYILVLKRTNTFSSEGIVMSRDIAIWHMVIVMWLQILQFDIKLVIFRKMFRVISALHFYPSSLKIPIFKNTYAQPIFLCYILFTTYY